MLKMLLTGIVLGVGLTTAFSVFSTVQGMQSMGDAMQREFAAPLAGDNLEAYRACLHGNDYGRADIAVDACREVYRDWLDSPTFSEELTKFRLIDPRGAAIMAEYRAANPEAVFD